MNSFVIRKNWRMGLIGIFVCPFILYQAYLTGIYEFLFVLFWTFGFVSINISLYFHEMFSIKTEYLLIKKKWRIYFTDIDRISVHETYGKGDGVYKMINIMIKLKNPLTFDIKADPKASWISLSKDRQEVFLSLEAPDKSGKRLKNELRAINLT